MYLVISDFYSLFQRFLFCCLSQANFELTLEKNGEKYNHVGKKKEERQYLI